MAIKCPKCGLENRPDARFCKQCGQTLQAQATPPSSPPYSGTICPACGATAKPQARFCPRCGKPLPAESTPSSPPTSSPVPAPAPSTSAQPAMSPATRPHTPPPSSPPPAQPPGYTQPPFRPPPPSAPTAPSRRFPSWSLWVGGIVAFICIIALAVTAVVFGPKIFGGEPTALPTSTRPPTVAVSPTETPTPVSEAMPSPTPTTEASPAPTFDAQVTIAASATELQMGSVLTITVTIQNTGQVPFGSLRYQLLGAWEPFLEAPTGATAGHEVNILPGESDTTIFILEAVQPGTAQIHANVTVDTREDPPATRPVSSEYVVEVSIVQ